MENTKLKEEAETKKERQKFQMHKDGYEKIVKAIESIPKTEVNIPPMPEMKPINMDETNKILEKLVEKMNEPICVKLNLT